MQSCGNTITRALTAAGAQNIVCDIESKTVTCEYEGAETVLVEALDDVGFEAQLQNP